MTATKKQITFMPRRCTSKKPTASPTSQLIAKAWEVRRHASADYSGFKVGAALRAADGTISTGCNVENATYGLTVCAERVAVFKALSEGLSCFSEIAIVTSGSKLTPPCGACRQILWEFCGNLTIHLANDSGGYRRMKMTTLFPSPFESSHFKKSKNVRLP